MKTAVITGTTRGIGRALVNKFLNEGFKVIGTSRSGKSDIDNPNFKIIQLDLTDALSIKRATEEILNQVAEINVLINNSGFDFDDFGIENIDADKLRKTIEINLIGPVDFTEKLLPRILNNGQIVFLSTRLASLTKDYTSNLADSPSYRISKTAVNMYSKTLAARLKSKGVIVSAVHPGWVKTYMGGSEAPREPEEAAEQIYKLAITRHETGKFWYDNKKFPW